MSLVRGIESGVSLSRITVLREEDFLVKYLGNISVTANNVIHNIII